jgi:RNA polymerase nonessential primary-like sigma factor
MTRTRKTKNAASSIETPPVVMDEETGLATSDLQEKQLKGEEEDDDDAWVEEGVESPFSEEAVAIEAATEVEWEQVEVKQNSAVYDVVQFYLQDIRRARLLTAEEELALSRRAKAGDFEARQKMIECNLRLVVNVAKHYMSRGMPLADLIEEGNIGLMRALDKFNPELGYRFSTYAIWWIRRKIERSIINQTRTIRLPSHVIRELNIVLKTVRQLESTGEGQANDLDVAQASGKTLEEARHLLVLNESMASLDSVLTVDPNITLGDSIQDANEVSAEDRVQQNEVGHLVQKWLYQLSPKERYIIERRFGLSGYEAVTLEHLAGEIGVTRERVRQVQVEALTRLRKVLVRFRVEADSLY